MFTAATMKACVLFVIAGCFATAAQNEWRKNKPTASSWYYLLAWIELLMGIWTGAR